MVGKKEIRNYEVSVWTLQDSFITVLKPSNLENKGQIMDGSMTLKDDGDNKLSFKIPMYVRNNKGELIENPLWHNTINGVILSGLRKIKVVFNKNTEDEAVYEFVIINVDESHEGKQQYCQVDCEGLAFHELGKQGFKIFLDGAEEIDAAQKSFKDKPETSGFSTLPMGNLNYWANRVFEGSNWRYSIQMDWSARDGITYQEYTLPSGIVLRSTEYENFTEEQKIQFNILRSQEDNLWRRNKIYEEPFITSWEVSENETNLQPTSIKDQEEKIRMIEGKESNRYNLSQSIAEMFQVFCRYKYYYDENYHIIDREAIFYNNFLNEFEGVIDLTYSYNTQHLSRNMDSKDVVSKMYVAPLSDADSPTEETSISDTAANKSLEDYILNFDYLYDIGTITQEQYDAIEPFEAEMRKINEEYNGITNSLIPLNAERSIQKATADHANTSYGLCLEELGKNNDLKANLTGNSGVIEITELNPRTWPVFSKKENKITIYYCNASDKGIIASTDENNTLHLYKSYNATTHKLSDEIGQNKYELDKPQGVLTQIIFKDNSIKDIPRIYAIFHYNPQLANETIIKDLQNKMAIDQNIKDRANARLEEIDAEIEKYTTRQEELLAEKKNKINKFEQLMGPALREGKWQPEDQYTGYGEPHDVTLNLFNNQTINDNDDTNTSDELTSIIWDNELFDEEQKYYYTEGLTETKVAYPCIELTEDILTKFSTWADKKNFTQRVNFVYSTTETDVSGNKRYLAIDSQMIFGFLRNKTNGNVIPVLILTGLKGIKSDNINNPHLAFIQIDQDTGQIKEPPDTLFSELSWVINIKETTTPGIIENYETVFPRIKINSNTLRSPNTNITVQCRDETIENYQDFYILSRVSSYFITIKPYSIIPMLEFPWESKGIDFKIHFVVSTAALAIYLDAIKIAKENAYPKVSYEIDVASVNEKFSHTLYRRLGQVAHINDAEFKFENTMGYISEVTLDLDKPWQDKIIIKNYKTKFEDLFSTIVAETEQMQKNAAAIGIAAGAFHSDGTLDESIFAPFLQRVLELTTVNVPTPESIYLEVEPYIRTLLRNTYKEAGEILEAVNSSVKDVDELNIKNSEILALYRDNIKEMYTSQTFRLGTFNIDGEEKTYNGRYNESAGIENTINFKKGDILKKGYYLGDGDNRKYFVDNYVAIMDSSAVSYPAGATNEEKSKSLDGWARTYNSSLAQIKGANLDINADTGVISIKSENGINLGSAKDINIEANKTVNILGNNLVNISGPTINLSSVYPVGNTIKDTGGIHLLVTATDENGNADTAKPPINAVDITSKGVAIAAADGIQMKAGKELNFYSSTKTETSVLSISSDNGIYFGSTQSITFYSGDDMVDVSSSNTNLTGASAQISSDRILFGVADSVGGNAIDIRRDAIILGSTKNFLSGLDIATGSSDGAAGVYISQNEIRMATQPENQTYRNLISMDNNGITISTSDSSNNGAFVQVNRRGVSIGTAPESGESPFITKIKNGSNYYDDSLYPGAKFQVYAPNFVVTDRGKLYAYDAYISGTIYANAGQIGNWELKTLNNESYLFGGSGENQVGLKVGRSVGDISFWAGNNPENAPFRVTNEGVLHATNAEITGAITATSLKIGEQGIGIDDYIAEKAPQASIPGNYATLTVENGYLNLSSTEVGNNGINSQSNVRISKDKIYLGTTGSLEIASGNFKVNSDGDVELTGKVTATSGQIGGWYLAADVNDAGYIEGYLGNGANVSSSSVGIRTKPNDSGAIAFWAGNYYGSQPPFRVTGTGYLFSENANIKGTIEATSGQIGGWYLNASVNDAGYTEGYLGNGASVPSSTVGIRTKPNDLGAIAFWAGGEYSKNPPFRVTGTGYLISTSGKIGGWDIETDYLGTDKIGISNTKKYFMWYGTEPIDIDNDPSATVKNSTKFYVTADGDIYSRGTLSLEPEGYRKLREATFWYNFSNLEPSEHPNDYFIMINDNWNKGGYYTARAAADILPLRVGLGGTMSNDSSVRTLFPVGQLPVLNGGTGASSAAGARVNLGFSVVEKSDKTNGNGNIKLEMSSRDYIIICIRANDQSYIVTPYASNGTGGWYANVRNAANNTAIANTEVTLLVACVNLGTYGFDSSTSIK